VLIVGHENKTICVAKVPRSQALVEVSPHLLERTSRRSEVLLGVNPIFSAIRILHDNVVDLADRFDADRRHSILRGPFPPVAKAPEVPRGDAILVMDA
jgi:hypothetical protein